MQNFARQGALAVAFATVLGSSCAFADSNRDAASVATSDTDRVVVAGHVLPALSRATLIGRAASAATERSGKSADAPAPMTLTVSLRRSNQRAFETYLHDVYDPQSPLYRQFLGPALVADRFGPTAQDYEAVRTFFVDAGFRVVGESTSRMTLTVSGDRSLVESALGVGIGDYELGQRRFFANSADPQLPLAIAGKVEFIGGLSDLALASRRKTASDPRAGNNKEALAKAYCAIAAYFHWDECNKSIRQRCKTCVSTSVGATADAKFCDGLLGGLDDKDPGCKASTTATRTLSALATSQAPGPSQSAGTHAMTNDERGGRAKPEGGPVLDWSSVTGSGQKIGLVEFDTFDVADVGLFLAYQGLPQALLANLTQVHVNGGAPAGANQAEVLVDIDFIMPVASGAAVTVYDAPFSGAGSFQALFNRMIGDGVSIISNSWAYCEDQTTLADAQSIDAILATAAASGISVFNASGDSGSTCLDGAANTIGVPADSPHATAVGGSSLISGPGATYQSETWWNGASHFPPTGQGGFGTSHFFDRPSYQDGHSAAAKRSIPDVVTAADPANGIEICQAASGGCPNGLLYGGTSMSAPAWAAYTALLNEAQGSNLGFLNPLLYPLAADDAFHSASELGSDFAHVGVGSPNVNRLHVALSGVPLGIASSTRSQIFYEESSTLAFVPDLGAPADGVTPFYVVVQLRDANGNTLSGKSVSLSADPGLHAAITPATGTSSVANGAVVFTVTDATAETLQFTATDITDNVQIPGLGTIAFFTPSATSGSIVASPANVPPNGVTTTTITVTLVNAAQQPPLPSSGKLITLNQGSGHSIITAPSPAITDVNGQVQFTATDGVSELVTYTAVDVSDGDLPIPGSAIVSFTGTATSCVAAPPVAGAGFVISPWATGFFAENFFFGNVNWGGCTGASNPTFTPSGTALVADFRTGDLFSFGLNGGAAAGHALSNLNPTLGQPTFGKDGRLYATHGATTGNFFTGNIVEIDPVTGAQIRVVASNLVCPTGLAVDPLSGDLFFDDECFGGGSDNASIFRIHDPASTATLSVYATLPATPNGQLAFAPDGTLFAVAGYNSIRQIIQIGGTSTVAPPTMTTLPGISSFFCLTMGEAQSNGAAKSLIVCDPNGLELIDISTTPFTAKLLVASGSVGSGTIGPDGCLYTGGQDTVYKLSPSSGGCGFVPTNPAPALLLSPALVSPNPGQGSTQSFTATFANISEPTGTPVTFLINGVNLQTKLAMTDANGNASIAYVGTRAGADMVVAHADVGALHLTSNSTRVTWAAGKHVSFLSLDGAPSGGIVGTSVALRATLADASVNPNVPIAGASIHFTLGAQSCNGTTNAQGLATCNVTLSLAGQLTLTATYAGSVLYTSATAAQGFALIAAGGPTSAPPGPPSIVGITAGDGRLVVAFAPPISDGGSPISSYRVTCSPLGGGSTASNTGSASPITVFNLSNGVPYVCTVTAANNAGPGTPSTASDPVSPFGAALVASAVPTLDRSHALWLTLMLGAIAVVLFRRRHQLQRRR